MLTRNQDVDGAVGGLPDLGAGGLVVDLRVVGVLELLQHERVGRRGQDLLGLGDRSLPQQTRRGCISWSHVDSSSQSQSRREGPRREGPTKRCHRLTTCGAGHAPQHSIRTTSQLERLPQRYRVAPCCPPYLHALGGVREDELGAEGAQQDAPLHRHAGRHGKDQLIALGRRDERQPDAGVTAGRLNQGGLRMRGCGGTEVGSARDEWSCT
jgi:hypothetical protein